MSGKSLSIFLTLDKALEKKPLRRLETLKIFQLSLSSRGCSTVAEHTPQNLEVMGSTPTGSWAFFFFFPPFLTFSRKWSVVNHVPQGGAKFYL